MSTLITRGYASRMPNRRFTLGARSLRLASGWVDRLLQLASVPMHRIADTCGETVYLLQLVGTEAVTLARLSAGRRATIDGEVGPELSALADGRRVERSLARCRLRRAKRCCPRNLSRPSQHELRPLGPTCMLPCGPAGAVAFIPRRARTISSSAVTPRPCSMAYRTRNWR